MQALHEGSMRFRQVDMKTPLLRLERYGFGPGGNYPGGTSLSTISAGQWTMITVVYSLAKQQLTFYKNGVFDGASANDVVFAKCN